MARRRRRLFGEDRFHLISLCLSPIVVFLDLTCRMTRKWSVQNAFYVNFVLSAMTFRGGVR
jgi:hypothetical protein